MEGGAIVVTDKSTVNIDGCQFDRNSAVRGCCGTFLAMCCVFFVGWGTLALINAGLAQGKNRSGLAWFLISLALGPMATFLIVVFFPKLHAREYGTYA